VTVSAIMPMTGFYDYSEVARSILIAIAASYAALDLAGRVTAASGRVRLAWLSGGAIAMGIGIWTMHLKGMLAFGLPVPVEYYWPTLLVGLSVAIFASAVALYVTSRPNMSRTDALTGSIVMSAGIAGLHYSLMAAMRMPAITRYSPLLVACSILLAVLFSLIALLMAFGLREETRGTVPRKIGSAIVMGIAISAMHYTGMAAASFFPGPPPDLSHTVSNAPIAGSGVVVATLLVLVAAIFTSSVDRRAHAEIRQVNQDLERRVAERTSQLEAVNQALRKEIAERERAEEALRTSEREQHRIAEQLETERARLIEAQAVAKVGSWETELPSLDITWTEQTHRIFETDPSYFHPTRPGFVELVHPEDRAKVDAAFEASLEKGAASTVKYRIVMADGRVKVLEDHWKVFHDGQGRPARLIGTCQDITERQQAEEDLRGSEDRLRLVIDTIPQQIWSGPADGSLDFCNAQWRSYTGLTLEELQGEGWQRILHPEDRERVLTSWRESVANGTPYEQEERHRRADGQYRWFLARGVPLRDSEGHIIRWYGTNTDIEDRKEADGRLRLVIDTLPALVWSKLPDGSADFLNKRFREYTGLSEEEGLGWGWMKNAFHPEDRAEEEWRAAFAAGEPFEKEARLRREDSSYRWFLLRAVPLRDETGNVIKWYGSTTDIEDRKRAEEALLEAQHKLALVARIQAMAELAATIAHEVNQPLTAIVTNASFSLRQLGGSTPNFDEVRTAITEIVNDGTRASAVISRIRGLLVKGTSRRVDLDINRTIRDVIVLLGNELSRNHVHLRTELAFNLPRVHGDPVQLQQVLINLVMNALDAMRLSTEQARNLLIRSAKNADDIWVLVQDSGPGIEPDLAARIFEPFFTTKVEGTGMGLSISRSIIESHGGHLSLVSSSQGALFEFTLPVTMNE